MPDGKWDLLQITIFVILWMMLINDRGKIIKILRKCQIQITLITSVSIPVGDPLYRKYIKSPQRDRITELN